MASFDQKLRTLYLKETLLERSDDEHMLNASELYTILNQECDMVYRAMILVKYFTPNCGEEYYDVLYSCYCRSRKAADMDVMLEYTNEKASYKVYPF